MFSGSLGQKVEDWRRKLIRSAALLEATLDFSDEDVPVDVYPEVQSLIDAVVKDLKKQAAGTQMAERYSRWV